VARGEGVEVIANVNAQRSAVRSIAWLDRRRSILTGLLIRSKLRSTLSIHGTFVGGDENIKVSFQEREVDCPRVRPVLIGEPDGIDATVPAVVTNAPDLAELVPPTGMRPQT
jgi:hypothetical protein